MLIILRPPAIYPKIAPSFHENTINRAPTEDAKKAPPGIKIDIPAITIAIIPKTLPNLFIIIPLFYSLNVK